MRKYRFAILFAVLTVCIIGFIWSNSCMSREVSSEQSGFWMQLLHPLLDPQGKLSEEVFHHWVRKTAHFAEFAMLGAALGGLFAAIDRQTQKRFYAFPALMLLLVAVLDEHIQIFTDRGSQVADVILDFAGGIAGLVFAVCVEYLLRRIKK